MLGIRCLGPRAGIAKKNHLYPTFSQLIRKVDNTHNPGHELFARKVCMCTWVLGLWEQRPLFPSLRRGLLIFETWSFAVSRVRRFMRTRLPHKIGLFNRFLSRRPLQREKSWQPSVKHGTETRLYADWETRYSHKQKYFDSIRSGSQSHMRSQNHIVQSAFKKIMFLFCFNFFDIFHIYIWH